MAFLERANHRLSEPRSQLVAMVRRAEAPQIGIELAQAAQNTLYLARLPHNPPASIGQYAANRYPSMTLPPEAVPCQFHMLPGKKLNGGAGHPRRCPTPAPAAPPPAAPPWRRAARGGKARH